MCLLEWFRSVENFPNPIADNCPIEKLVRNVNMRLIRILHYEYLQVSENQRLKFFSSWFFQIWFQVETLVDICPHTDFRLRKSTNLSALGLCASRVKSASSLLALNLWLLKICFSDLATCSEPLIRRKAAANCSGSPAHRSAHTGGNSMIIYESGRRQIELSNDGYLIWSKWLLCPNSKRFN